MMNKSTHSIDVRALLEQTGWLQSMARALVSDHHRAEEITQDTLAAAIEHPPSGANEIPVLRAWLARVMRNFAQGSAIKEANRVARDAASAKSEVLPSTLEAVERAELRKHLTDAILGLPSPYREVVILRHLENLSTRQVAARTGASEPAVRTQLSRGLGMLRERLDAKYGVERKAWMAIALPLAGASRRLAAGGSAAGFGILALKAFGVLAASWMVVGLLQFTSSPAVDRFEAPQLALVPRQAEEVLSSPGPGAQASAAAALVQADANRSDRTPESRNEVAPVREVQLHRVLASSDSDFASGTRFAHHNADTVSVLGAAHFFSVEIASVSQDAFGYPALNVRLEKSSQAEFHEWTKSLVGQLMAVVIEGKVASMATVNAPLPPQFLITGGSVPMTQETLTQFLRSLGFPGPEFEPYVFFGYVTSTSDGRPLDALEFGRTSMPSEPQRMGDGLFMLRVTEVSVESLKVARDGFTTAQVSLGPGHESPATALPIDLVELAHLQVHVTDGAGQPVSDAFLILSPMLPCRGQRPRWSRDTNSFGGIDSRLRTNSMGLASRSDLDSDMLYSLSLYTNKLVWDGGGLPARSQMFVLAPGQHLELRLELPAGRTVRGRVVGPTGGPLGNLRVGLARPSQDLQQAWFLPEDWGKGLRSTTDANGRFEFKGVPDGQWQVGVLESDESRDEKSRGLTIPIVSLVVDENTPLEEITVPWTPASPTRGVVLDSSSRPLVRQVVFCWKFDSDPNATPFLWIGQTGDDGSFQTPGFLPGKYALSTLFQGSVQGTQQVVEAGKQDVVLTHRPCFVQARFRGIPNPSMLQVAGQLFDNSREALAALPQLRFERYEGDAVLTSKGLLPGEYSLCLRTRDGRVGFAKGLRVGAEEPAIVADVDLVPGVPLQLHLNGPCSIKAFEIRLEGAQVAAGTIVGGLSETVLVPPGDLEVRLLDRDGQRQSTKRVNAHGGSPTMVHLP